MSGENGQDMFADSLARILADHAPTMHQPGGAELLWKDLDQAEFPRALSAQSAGGSGVAGRMPSRCSRCLARTPRQCRWLKA